MWEPYSYAFFSRNFFQPFVLIHVSLPECGHIFCFSCLQNSFANTLAQFRIANPHYNVDQAENIPHLQHLFQVLLQNPQAAHRHREQVVATLAKFLEITPQYTCPMCQEPVRTRPMQVFAMKAIVRVLSEAAGESSPKKNVNENRKAGPWDRFFPPMNT